MCHVNVNISFNNVCLMPSKHTILGIPVPRKERRLDSVLFAEIWVELRY